VNEEERKEAVALYRARAEAATSQLRKKEWGEEAVRAVDNDEANDEIAVLMLSKSDVAFVMGVLALHAGSLSQSDSLSYAKSAARALELAVSLGEQGFEIGVEK
jgi:hypothetical protein